MPNYQEMYLHLFRETTKAIEALQEAQKQTEELYLADDSEAIPTSISPGAEIITLCKTEGKHQSVSQ